MSSTQSSPATKSTPKTDSSTLYIPPHLRSNSTDFDDHSGSAADMDEDQQQQYYYYHHRSSMDTVGHATAHSQPPIIKNKQQIIDYLNQHKISSILKTKLNEAFQKQSLDPIEYVFRTKKVAQQEIIIHQRQQQMKEMDIKHDEVLSSIQQSKESMKSEYEKSEKEHLYEISKLQAELKELKEKASSLTKEPVSPNSTEMEKLLEQLKLESEQLEKENQTLLKRNKDLVNILGTTGSSQPSTTNVEVSPSVENSPSEQGENTKVSQDSVDETSTTPSEEPLQQDPSQPTIEIEEATPAETEETHHNIVENSLDENMDSDPFASLDDHTEEQ